ncbi:MAG: tyrosine-type recombinase/integrase [Bacteroidetes bacterium]|nr:tyrosine-type recombinase/integrase [Bacteroidota bacterium]MCA6444917.1 tyrosine-type recombinase/integrase [Bacteroidota bacterium]
MKTSVNKIHLGKSRDSRTRRKLKPRQSVQSQTLLLNQHKDYRNYLLAKDYSNASISQLLNYLDAFKNYLKKENIEDVQVSYNDVTSYIQTLKIKNKQRSIQTNVNAIKIYFNYLIHQNIIAENPFSNVHIRGIKRKILYNILSKKELESLYNNFKIPDDTNDKNKNQNWFKTALLASQRNKIIIGLLVYQGLKTEELNTIEISDLKLREGTLFINGTRRSNERVLQLESHQILDLMEYVLKTRLEILKLKNATLSGVEVQSTRLIVSTGKSERIQNSIQKLIPKLSAINPRLTNIKQLRASVITHWLKLYNLREVQYRAGHRFVSSTESYLVNDIEDLLEDVIKYHPIG